MKTLAFLLSLPGMALVVLASTQAPQNDLAHPLVGVLGGSPLERLGVTTADLRGAQANPSLRYAGLTKFLNQSRTVVTGSLDDSNTSVPRAIDALDAYGIKATIAVSTQSGPIAQLWPRLRAAVEQGHEIGSHSRRHQCQWPDTATFCRSAYSQDEVEGSRDDILAQTDQKYVWTWVYPCGNCADQEFVHQRLQRAGYLVARNYPDERRGGHLVPDLQSWAADPYNAAYTQVVQKLGGVAPAGRTDLTLLNRKFDEVHAGPGAGGAAVGATPSADGGIYQFMSHPAWIDFGPDQFFEKHLAHVGGRTDVWYVPLGPLYAYQVVREQTVVTPLIAKDGWARFAVHNRLDPAVYDNAVTLAFVIPAAMKVVVRAGTRTIAEKVAGTTDRWNVEYFRRNGTTTLVTIRPNTIVYLQVTE